MLITVQIVIRILGNVWNVWWGIGWLIYCVLVELIIVYCMINKEMEIVLDVPMDMSWLIMDDLVKLWILTVLNTRYQVGYVLLVAVDTTYPQVDATPFPQVANNTPLNPTPASPVSPPTS